MRIKAEILKTSTRPVSNGQMATIFANLENPDDIIQVSIFNTGIQNGYAEFFKNNAGKQVEFDVSVSIYRDALSYSLYSDGNPKVLENNPAQVQPQSQKKIAGIPI